MALTQMYKGYMILTRGVSQYIFKPDSPEIEQNYPLSSKCNGYAQSMTAAKRWINEDIRNSYVDAVKEEMKRDGYEVL